ncbi:MAG TPA: polysaccharide deacetylase family protein [Cyclobacteriaceae bacterium]|nr:polysaccharide deacetylase family protein [Cyclobacteriaceae bacterium]
MNKAILILLLLSVVITMSSSRRSGQNTDAWNKKKCAVVLTYDDALNIHLDQVIPALDSFNFKATFYLTGYSPGFSNRIADWRKVAKNGHELGNHTLFHPCTGGPGREWVSAERDLSHYTVKRIEDEIKMNNILLQSVDGKTRRTFAYPCGDTDAGGTSYVDAIKDDFAAARGTREGMVSRGTIDLFNIDCYAMNGQTGEEMIDIVRKALKQGGLVVFLFHGVGGEHNLNVSLRNHSQLLHFLKENEKEIWIAPLIDVVDYIQTKN